MTDGTVRSYSLINMYAFYSDFTLLLFAFFYSRGALITLNITILYKLWMSTCY